MIIITRYKIQPYFHLFHNQYRRGSNDINYIYYYNDYVRDNIPYIY